jgi:hypothetical protein
LFELSHVARGVDDAQSAVRHGLMKTLSQLHGKHHVLGSMQDEDWPT